MRTDICRLGREVRRIAKRLDKLCTNSLGFQDALPEIETDLRGLADEVMTLVAQLDKTNR